MSELRVGGVYVSEAFGAVEIVAIDGDTVHFKRVDAWAVAAPMRANTRVFQNDFQSADQS